MKFFAAIFLASIAVSSAFSAGDRSAQNKEGQPRIVGGIEATPHEFPHQVALRINGLSFCGGSLIDEYNVLTAAHCAARARVVNVVLGSHNLSDSNEASRVTIVSRNSTTHEDWTRLFVRNDIALIHLESPAPLTPEIRPIDLPTGYYDEPLIGDMITVSGWGLDSDNSNSVSPVLRRADAPVIASSVCADYYSNITVSDNVGCIDSTGGIGTCSGDSGGPLMSLNNADNKIYGITSFGSSEGCEVGAPDAFTRVAHYLDWIADNRI